MPHNKIQKIGLALLLFLATMTIDAKANNTIDSTKQETKDTIFYKYSVNATAIYFRFPTLSIRAYVFKKKPKFSIEGSYRYRQFKSSYKANNREDFIYFLINYQKRLTGFTPMISIVSLCYQDNFLPRYK